MAFLELNSDITIGSFRFSGVHAVEIKRSIHSISETATITLPSKTNIIKSDRSVKEDVVTGEQFKEGDRVEIKLGYNGELRTEFTGFVRKRNLDRPLVVECEGYSFCLRKIVLDTFATNVLIGDLLNRALGERPAESRITVQSTTDLRLDGLRMPNMKVTDLINKLIEATDDNLTCFFIEPNVLWCGMLYASVAKGNLPFTLGEVKYKLGYNTISNKELKLREGGVRLKVSYVRKIAGVKKTYVSDAYKNNNKEYSKLLNHPSEASLKMLANEKAYYTGYIGFEGKIETFLQPYVATGFIADISSDTHKEHNGKYLVVGTEVKFGVNGGRRLVELGPKLDAENKKQ